MSEPCELLANCGFFSNYKGNSEAIREGWIRMFCEDHEKSERCARKKFRKMLGIPPEDNMSPSGKLLL